MLIDKIETQRAIFNSILCFLMWMGFIYLQSENPFAFCYFLAEDWWGENATFGCYLAAFLLIAISMKINKSIFKPGYILLALGFLFIAMEEISWGQRIFNISVPEAISRNNYQSELNFHNSVGISFITIFGYLLLAWIIVLPILSSKVKVINRWIDSLGIPMITLSCVPCFLFALYVVLAEPLINGEAGELMLGMVFLFYAAEIFVKTVNHFQPQKVYYVTTIGLMLLLVLGVTNILVAKSSEIKKYNWRLYFSASQSYPAKKMYDQAGILFEYMINNPAFKYNEDYLVEYGEMLMKRRNPKVNYILHKALEQQHQLEEEKPDVASCNRRLGKIWMLLGDPMHAGREFQAALQKDRTRFEKSEKESEKSEILFSLAKTYREMKDYNSAIDSARKAFELTSLKQEKTTIKEWIEQIAQ